ncbi:MAG: phosphoribosylglycinamide formyltransferase [Candidatus Thorarchaeota archaeon]
MSRVGVLVSGRGTNLQALIDACQKGQLGGEIKIVISNKKDALAIERAKRAGIKTEIVTKKEFPTREEHDKRVLEILIENGIDLVILAGYMRILSEVFLSEYENRIINVHPSLLPAFKGTEAQKQAIEYGVRFSGCTTHFVNHDMDGGPIILQRVVPVMENDTAESLADRILAEEHKILVESVRLYLEGRLNVTDRKVVIKEDN